MPQKLTLVRKDSSSAANAFAGEAGREGTGVKASSSKGSSFFLRLRFAEGDVDVGFGERFLSAHWSRNVAVAVAVVVAVAIV